MIGCPPPPWSKVITPFVMPPGRCTRFRVHGCIVSLFLRLCKPHLYRCKPLSCALSASRAPSYWASQAASCSLIFSALSASPTRSFPVLSESPPPSQTAGVCSTLATAEVLDTRRLVAAASRNRRVRAAARASRAEICSFFSPSICAALATSVCSVSRAFCTS